MPTALTLAAPALPAGDSNGPGLLPGLLMAGGVLLAVMLLLRGTRRSARRRAAAPQPASERIQELHETAAHRARADDALADAEEFARRLAAVLDTKAARLEVLIEQAEAAIARLERAAPRAPGLDLGDTPAPPPPSPSRLDPRMLERARLDVLRRESPGAAPAPAPARSAAEASPRTPTASSGPVRPPTTPGLDHEAVYRLADDGRPPLEIARALGRPVGQVELILNLRRRQSG